MKAGMRLAWLFVLGGMTGLTVAAPPYAEAAGRADHDGAERDSNDHPHGQVQEGGGLRRGKGRLPGYFPYRGVSKLDLVDDCWVPSVDRWAIWSVRIATARPARSSRPFTAASSNTPRKSVWPMT